MSRFRRKPRALSGPRADPLFQAIAAPEIRGRVLLARVVHGVRTSSQALIGRPLGYLLLQVWLKSWPGARWVERLGLPRHSIETLLGEHALTLHVNPRMLYQFGMHAPRKTARRPSSMAFIWDGDWDLRRDDLRIGPWIAFMRDLDENRMDLTRTEKYQSLLSDLQAGKPFRSHQEGVFLNSPERILAYVNVYLSFLDNMAERGYEHDRAKDGLGVVISREGRILKIRRGLHRLAMAQWLGLPSIPVQVRHIHREWWAQVTAGTTGREALERIRNALQHCTPETQPGPLTEGAPTALPADFWPQPSYKPGAVARHDSTAASDVSQH